MKKLFLILSLFSLYNFVQTKNISKPYVKKQMYEGLGKRSNVNGLPKTKGISGHWKGNPAKGYKFVNAYSRSK